MNVGDDINGYRITTPPTNAGGGMSQWSFAERDGEEYFIKMFLAPRYPLPESPGSEEAKARKREACHSFESRHLEIARRLAEDEEHSANLVIPRDFFRVGSSYVKVMDRVWPSPLPETDQLTARQVTVLVRSLLLSLGVLHRCGIVHGDLKPDNVMVQQRGEVYISKLIDFDEAYVAGDPPAPELIVGDPAFYSPELLAYVKGAEQIGPEDLGLASDMFSLGLLLHHTLSGAAVSVAGTGASYPAEVVASGLPLHLAPVPDAMAETVAGLLSGAPDDRPDITEVTDLVLSLEPEDLAHDRRVTLGPVVSEPILSGSPHEPGSGPAEATPVVPVVDVATAEPAPEPGRGVGGSDSGSEDQAAARALRSTMGRKPRDPHHQEHDT